MGQHEVAHLIAEKSKVTSQAGITDESHKVTDTVTTETEEDEDISIHTCVEGKTRICFYFTEILRGLNGECYEYESHHMG